MTKLKQLCDRYAQSPTKLDYLSPSTINSFLGNKMGFIGRLVGFDRTDNINFQKGNTVERAVNLFFTGPPAMRGNWEECIKAAMVKFDVEASAMPKYADTRAYLPSLCQKAIETYASYNHIPICQSGLLGDIQGITFRGILDYEFPNHISDCKVTGSTPSKMSQAHKNAAWIYGKLTNKQVQYEYFIPLKGGPRHVVFEYEPESLTEDLVMTAATTVRMILSDLDSDPERIEHYARIFMSDPDQGFGDCPEINYYLGGRE